MCCNNSSFSLLVTVTVVVVLVHPHFGILTILGCCFGFASLLFARDLSQFVYFLSHSLSHSRTLTHTHSCYRALSHSRLSPVAVALNLQQEQLALRAAEDVVSVQIFSHAVKSTKLKVVTATSACPLALHRGELSTDPHEGETSANELSLSRSLSR